MRVAHRGEHAGGHRLGGHPQLGVHAGHHDIKLGEQVLPLVKRTVLQDVDLDPGQDPERGQRLVELPDQPQLLASGAGGEPARHREAGRVIGQRDPLVPEIAGGRRHLGRRAAAVRPVGVGVAVAAQRRPHRGRLRRGRLVEQPGQVGRPLAVGRRRDDPGR